MNRSIPTVLAIAALGLTATTPASLAKHGADDGAAHHRHAKHHHVHHHHHAHHNDDGPNHR
jgi:ABC-type Zn2+ transport system substrate-binding protein/surface adhesin